MYYEVYINNKLCDLSPGTKIALSLAINNIGEAIRPLGSYTNQIKLPKTQNNIDICEVAHSLNSDTSFPYQKLPARLNINGRELISDGFAVIEQAQYFYELTIYGGNLDFFEAIKDKKLTDLDFSSLEHTWSLRNVIDYRLNDSNVIYPVIDWSSDGNYMNNTEKRIDVRTIFPAMFGHSIVDKIFDEASFNKSGNILTNAKYKSLIVPLVDKIPPASQTEKLNIEVSSAVGETKMMVAAPIANDSIFHLDIETSITDELSLWNYESFNIQNSALPTGHTYEGTTIFLDNTYCYTSFITGEYEIDLTLKCQFLEQTVAIPLFPTDLGTAYLEFWVLSLDGKTKRATTKTIAVADTSISIKENVKLEKGDKLFPVVYHSQMQASGWQGIFNARNLKIIPKDIPSVSFGTLFPVSENLPDMTQTDFLKSIAKIFGIIFQTNSFTKTVEFKQFKEIYDNIPKAKDWSNKLDLSKIPLIQFHADFAQENILKWTNDTGTDVPEKLGEGKILVSDTSLEKENTIIEVPFSATVMSKKLINVDVPVIKWLTAGAASGSVEPRILILDREDFTCRYSVGNTNQTGLMEIVNTNHATCYFQLDSKTFNLGFDDSLIGDNYNEFGFFLDKFKRVVCNIKLDENDIYEMDFFTPIYIEYFKQYFFISKINNFIDKTNSTQVELIRL